MILPAPALLLRNKFIEVLFDDRGGQVLVVTFNDIGHLADGGTFWAREPLRKLGFSALGIMSRQRNWHPQCGLTEFIMQARALRERFSTVILYGFSQGAYAAIRHSGLFGADHVLAFSPQASIDPQRIGGFDRRFDSYYRPDLHANMEVEPEQVSGRIMIFLDPLSRDRAHAKLIIERIAATLVPVPHLGHATIKAIASTDLLGRLLDLTVRSSPVWRFAALLREGRRRSARYYEDFATRCLNQRGRGRRRACAVLGYARQIVTSDRLLALAARAGLPPAENA